MTPYFKKQLGIGRDKASAQDDFQEALDRAFELGKAYWRQADSDLRSDWDKSDKTMAEFQALKSRFLQPAPQRPAAQPVPMTDEQFTQLLRKLKRSREVFQAGRDSYETACAPMNSDDEAWFAYLAHHGITQRADGGEAA